MSMVSQRQCEVCNHRVFRRRFTKDNHVYSECCSCHLLRIDPQPTDDELASIYGIQYYDGWGHRANVEQLAQLKKRTFRHHVLSAVKLSSGARVLDCGAAFGALMEVAAEQGLNPYGIELIPEAATAIARRLGSDRVFCGPFESAVFPNVANGGFQAVFMCDFIEHVRNPLAALKKAVAWLQPGGQLVITTPDSRSLSRRLMGMRWPNFKTEHLYYLNRQNLPMLLAQVGLTVRYLGRAKKTLDFEYIHHYFNAYPLAMVTPLLNLTARFPSGRWKNLPFSFSYGDMIVVAEKVPPATCRANS
jgi:2-polyprenyl-3-methyl-5-hydroxy-6-metoxy-1,4-benzoquinol methylase